MRAVLVAISAGNRVYYDLDSRPGEKDAIVEKADGTTIPVDLLSLANSSRSFTKLRSSPLQRFLWDAPKDESSGAWYETFVEKTRPVKDSLIESMPVHSALGKNKKKIEKSKTSVKSFISRTIDKEMLTKSCCGEMIKLDVNTYNFKTIEDRAFAWEAMKIMRQLEE